MTNPIEPPPIPNLPPAPTITPEPPPPVDSPRPGSPDVAKHPHNVVAAEPVRAPVTPLSDDKDEPIDFIGLLHSATGHNVGWPKKVVEWSEKRPANKHLLKSVQSVGGMLPINWDVVFKLLDEILSEFQPKSDKG